MGASIFGFIPTVPGRRMLGSSFFMAFLRTRAFSVFFAGRGTSAFGLLFFGFFDHGDAELKDGGGFGYKFEFVDFAVDVSALFDEAESVDVVLEAHSEGEGVFFFLNFVDQWNFSELLLQHILDFSHNHFFIFGVVHSNFVVAHVILDVRFGSDAVGEFVGLFSAHPALFGFFVGLPFWLRTAFAIPFASFERARAGFAAVIARHQWNYNRVLI